MTFDEQIRREFEKRFTSERADGSLALLYSKVTVDSLMRFITEVREGERNECIDKLDLLKGKASGTLDLVWYKAIEQAQKAIRGS